MSPQIPAKEVLMLLMLLLALSGHASTQELCARTANTTSGIRTTSYGLDSDELAKEFLLSNDDRIEIACQLKRSILRQYSALALKQERLSLNVVQHLDQCILQEAAIPEDSRLKFIDRMRKCVAAFQDTHMSASSRMPLPGVFTGIEAGYSKGKVLIVGRNPKILTYIETKDDLTNLREILPLGAEILEIDGRPALERARELAPYISASSERARLEWSTTSLFMRNFFYPAKNTVDVKVRLSDGAEHSVRLPWFSSSKVTNSVDANRELKRLGIPSLDMMNWNYDPLKQKWTPTSVDFEGYEASKALFPNSEEWQDSSDNSPAYRTAEVLVDRNRVFCYLQILTFSVDKVKNASTEKPFLEPIQAFINGCEAKQLPLILDLRSNGGGVASYPEQVFSYLAKKGEKYLPRAQAVRATKHSLWMFSQFEDSKSTRAKIFGSLDVFEKLAESLARAISKKEAHTEVIVGKPIEAVGKGFSQKIVALVSSDCISACDSMVMLLKNNKRATLIGTEANGTGAGFMTVGRISSNFADTYQFLQVQIPTSLFGAVKVPTAEGAHPFVTGKEWLTENRPTAPDVVYELDGKDILENGAGWKEKALSELFPDQGTVVPAFFRALF